jgi:phosphoribosylamine---glycine ligase
MDVLVIGSGGREYELGRQLALSPNVNKVYFAPGNGGTEAMEKGENVALAPDDGHGLAVFARAKKISLAVLGMDIAVAKGVGDVLRRSDIVVFGPSREAGQLEWSKAFAAQFMNFHNIPQPVSQVVRSFEDSLEALKGRPPQSYVLKADGLAAGKGVVLPTTEEEAKDTLMHMFDGTQFDGAGKSGVVIQERLHGQEISAFAISDGKDFVLLPLTQDYKRIGDNDEGPNTGGMGSYAPVPSTIVSDEQLAKIRSIAEQTIKGMAAEGTPYQGVLYMGLMLAEEHAGDPLVIEYNARFGDPEAEILLPSLSESGVDVADMLLQTAQGNLSKVSMPEKLNTAVLTVALASAGYPQNPRKGDEIFGLDKQYNNVIIQHAGTKREGDTWLTAGGRVLYVTGFGKTVDEAAAHAYAAIGDQGIHFNGMQYRKDIGHQARPKKLAS